jgi:ribosomal protein S18 acetylase RimI-like enzyme
LFALVPLTPASSTAVRRFILDHWSADVVVAHGRVYQPHTLPGFVAHDPAGEIVGLITYCLEGGDCEIVTLDSLRPGQGLGTALIEAVAGVARAAGCRRVRLITTNDNLNALRFYQKRGFRLVALFPNALAETRRLKPGLPLIGFDGIPLRDELALELPLEVGP